jgi:hypothetical protein
VASDKIEASWQAVKQNIAEMAEGTEGKKWKVTFKNPAIEDVIKQTLCMFYTLTGNFIAANFTGK